MKRGAAMSSQQLCAVAIKSGRALGKSFRCSLFALAMPSCSRNPKAVRSTVERMSNSLCLRTRNRGQARHSRGRVSRLRCGVAQGRNGVEVPERWNFTALQACDRTQESWI